ncbi:hypothetical protein BMF29_00315 [Comamonas kerstersii]|nr:hypothetical protein BMF38_15585 [Comamonas kerstersii]OOH97250.1 hypothetical protein BMF29_00315 [Comamonas kerstersii]
MKRGAMEYLLQNFCVSRWKLWRQLGSVTKLLHSVNLRLMIYQLRLLPYLHNLQVKPTTLSR